MHLYMNVIIQHGLYDFDMGCDQGDARDNRTGWNLRDGIYDIRPGEAKEQRSYPNQPGKTAERNTQRAK
jgi:hypothetical protein